MLRALNPRCCGSWSPRSIAMKQRTHLRSRNVLVAHWRPVTAAPLRQQVTLPDLATTKARSHSLSQSQLVDLSFAAATSSPFRSVPALADASFRYLAKRSVLNSGWAPTVAQKRLLLKKL